ncbi:MAG: Slp family lipoprotein [Thermodesulfobacteriota bacterium]
MGKIHKICSIIKVMKLNYFLWPILLCLLFACAPIFNKEKMKEVDYELTLAALINDPERYTGKIMILGGRIIKAEIKEGVTWIEVLQLPLDWRKKPKETDESAGRFLAFFADFHDPAIFSPGRKITVLGLISGRKTLSIGEKEYHYPVLKIKEAHLWPEESKSGVFFHFGIGLGGTF